MKKFIFILIGAILMFCSCSTSVTKDVKSILADGVKLAKIESVNITSDFYTYTHEFRENRDNYINAVNKLGELLDSIKDSYDDMKYYKYLGYNSLYNSYKSKYEEYKAQWEIVKKNAETYSNIDDGFKNNGKQSGKLYVAKVKGKDKITGKYLDFYSYQIFTYDSDGTIHPIDADNAIQIACSVFPNAKKDLKKAMEYAGVMVADALANLKI